MNQSTLDFLDRDQEQKEKLAKINNETSSESRGGAQLKISGTYVMEVDTGFYYDKEKNIHFVPDISETKKTKSIMLTFRLKVVDPTPQVKVGQAILGNLVILPKPGATNEEIQKVFNLSKPRLAAMLGTDKIKIEDKNWIIENLLAEFREVPGKNPELVRDHKMKGRILVILEDDVDNKGKPALKIKSITPASKTDKSISNTANIAVPPKSDVVDAEVVPVVDDEAAINALVDNSNISDIATVSEDFPG